MSRKRKRWVLGLVAVVVAAVALGSRWSEPHYRGRSLTAWLEQFADASLDEKERRSEAQKAICEIGAEKALPILLGMAKAHDGSVRSWINRKNENWDLRFLKKREAGATQQLAIAGFEVLETNCAPAVPELTRMLNDTNHAFTALRCLVCIGVPAKAPVCQALTNSSVEIRRFAASQLACVTDDMEVYLAWLKLPLSDPDSMVRFAAVQALGLQKDSPHEIVPFLVKAIADPQQSVSGYAAKFLGELGTNAVEAFDALSNVVETGNSYMATHALRSLVSIDGERALPMTLGWLQSSNADHRARAANVLGNYPPTPEILDRLKSAAQDDDSKVARTATASLRKYLQKEKDEGKYRVVIEGEPSYRGRLLGDWLKRRPSDNDVAEDAKQAIGELGTNALPALLARLVYADAKYGLKDYDASIEAVGGFALLGQRGQSALPKLEELINGDDERVAVLALISACNMGSNAVPVFMRAFTNDYADVRNEALNYLLEGPLTAFPEARKEAVPAIIEMLRDPDVSNRMNATNALKEIDPTAAKRAGVK
jgi:HEAT repeat protein